MNDNFIKMIKDIDFLYGFIIIMIIMIISL